MLIDLNNVMMIECKMSNLGLMRYFFGFQVKQMKCKIFISYEKYGDYLLKMFNIPNCKPISTHTGVNEKLKREDNEELTNDNI